MEIIEKLAKFLIALIDKHGPLYTALILLAVYVWQRIDKIEMLMSSTFRVYRKVLIRGRQQRISNEDIVKHPYFSNLDNLLAGASLTKFTTDSNTNDFKMYVADVVAYVTHWTYRKYFTDYIRKGNWTGLEHKTDLLLIAIGNDIYNVLTKVLNERIADLYYYGTEDIRDMYCDLLMSIANDPNPKYISRDRLYAMLNMMNYRIVNSHAMLSRVFIGMNGRLESQSSNIKPITKQELDTVLKADIREIKY